MGFITSLQLTNFRSYESAELTGLSSGPVVLYGVNGAGKTNVLEAVSLLAPGRGLRGARIAEIQKQGSDRSAQPWAIAAQAQTIYGPVRLGTGADPAVEKRLVRINGEAARSQIALGDYLACVWLTPQMDRLFLEGPSARRRFLDRLVFAFDAGHAGRVTRYDNALSQRSKILKEHENPDPAWLTALEATMAETGVAIAAARLDFMQRLQGASARADSTEERLFPRAQIRAAGTIEELLTRAPAVEVEEMFKYQLQESRLHDSRTGGAASDPHKSDMVVHYAAKNMPADQSSTGEQKALLIGIILAHSRLIAAERGAPPVLLLDEVAAHLDEGRRQGLYTLLQALRAQVFMTGTDRHLFAALPADSGFFEIREGGVAPALRGWAA